jgi:general L-amino acid transport system substrate-binding protein
MRTRLLLLLPLIAAVFAVQAQDAEPVAAGPTLTSVRARGQLICGVDEDVFGFGFLNPNTGEISGIQVDLCRALAAATTGEAAAVELRLYPLDTPPNSILDNGVNVFFQHTFMPAPGRWPALSVGQAITFYDGAAVLAQISSAVTTLNDLEGATICTQSGSPSEKALIAETRRRSLSYDPAAFATIAEMRTAFDEGRCTALVLERSLLEIIRQSSSNADALVVWPTPFTSRTINPLYGYGDKQWGEIVDWTMWGLIEAEKLGIASSNLRQMLRQPNESDQAYLTRVGEPAARLIDATLGGGGRLGLPSDFMAAVIAQVGNYGEIYERNLGRESALPIERGINALWRDGGLLDAPPWP